MALTYAAANSMISGNLIGRSQYSGYGQVYLALSKTTPSRDGTGVTEPTQAEYKGYARTLLGSYNEPSTHLMDVPANGATTNSQKYIMFPVADIGGSGCTVTHICFYSSATGGTLIAYQALTSSVQIPAVTSVKVVPVFDPNGLSISMT